MPSEIEMREFFQSVIDQVATLSTQAHRVEGLEARVNELSQRVDELMSQNGQLQRDLAQANDTIHSVQAQLEQSHRDFDNERSVSVSLRELIVQRDAKVTETETYLGQERDAHRITTSERDDARRVTQELGEQVDSFRNQLQETQRERDHWHAETSRLQAENDDLKHRLERITSILNPPHTVYSQDVA